MISGILTRLWRREQLFQVERVCMPVVRELSMTRPSAMQLLWALKPLLTPMGLRAGLVMVATGTPVVAILDGRGNVIVNNAALLDASAVSMTYGWREPRLGDFNPPRSVLLLASRVDDQGLLHTQYLLRARTDGFGSRKVEVLAPAVSSLFRTWYLWEESR